MHIWYSTSNGTNCGQPNFHTLLCSSPIQDLLSPEIFTINSSSLIKILLEDPTQISLSSLQGAILTATLFSQRLIGPCSPMEYTNKTLATLIRNQALLSCSNGSVIKGKGSHGWLFSGNDGTIILKGAGPDNGLPKLMSSY